MAPPPFLASWSDQGVYKHNTSPLQVLIRSTMGGALLGLAGLTCLIVNGSLTALNALYPGVGKLIFAMLFAVGIYMVSSSLPPSAACPYRSG
jgi:formate/nitrite transporter FocA (FNT family)